MVPPSASGKKFRIPFVIGIELETGLIEEHLTRRHRVCGMAAKKKPSRAATPGKKKAKPSLKKSPVRKPPMRGPALRQAVRQAALRVRRAGMAYVEKATELEAARIAQREAERRLAAFAASRAAQAAQERRSFYSFLAQGDSWLSYTLRPVPQSGVPKRGISWRVPAR